MVLITILGISIGYSSLNTELRVSGDAKVSVSSDIASNKILGDNGSKEAIEAKGEPDFSKTATTDEGMFAALDNDGTSYYYRGAVENNWLYFAGYYWRIIRINGDESIRIIYNGKTTNQTGSDTQIGVSAFNSIYDRSEYVGLKYTVGEQHGISTNSTILNLLNDWYEKNLLDYSDYINDSGFCNDREVESNVEWNSQPDNMFRYLPYIRLSSNKQASLICNNQLDILYVNNALAYPIGLITADEISLAGGLQATDNTYYYLYNGLRYWTMSPSHTSSGGGSAVFDMHDLGKLYGVRVDDNIGVRPVINLKKDIMLSGNGTRENPYRIVN